MEFFFTARLIIRTMKWPVSCTGTHTHSIGTWSKHHCWAGKYGLLWPAKNSRRQQWSSHKCLFRHFALYSHSQLLLVCMCVCVVVCVVACAWTHSTRIHDKSQRVTILCFWPSFLCPNDYWAPRSFFCCPLFVLDSLECWKCCHCLFSLFFLAFFAMGVKSFKTSARSPLPGQKQTSCVRLISCV